MIAYIKALSIGKVILWCYLIWYLVSVYYYFDPSPAIWLNSVGISLVIGVALQLSVSSPLSWGENKWQTFRLFLMPFGVSSFSSLIKGQGYFLIIPPQPVVCAVSLGLCLIFILLVLMAKRLLPEPRA